MAEPRLCEHWSACARPAVEGGRFCARHARRLERLAEEHRARLADAHAAKQRRRPPRRRRPRA